MCLIAYLYFNDSSLCDTLSVCCILLIYLSLLKNVNQNIKYWHSN